MKLLGALSVTWLGVQSVIGGPLVTRDAQGSDTMPANRRQNIDVPTNDNKNQMVQAAQQALGWAAAFVGMPLTYYVAHSRRGREVNEWRSEADRLRGEAGRLRSEAGKLRGDAEKVPDLERQVLVAKSEKWPVEVELEWARRELQEIKSQGRPPRPMIVTVEGVGSMTLKDYELYLSHIYGCVGVRLQLMGVLTGSDRKKLLDHVGVKETNAQFTKNVAGECTNEVSAWFKAGRPDSGTEQSPVWKEAQEKVRSYRRPHTPVVRGKGRKGKGKMEGGDKTAFSLDSSLDSAGRFLSDIPRTVSRISSDIIQGAPKMVKYVAAGIASNGRTALQSAAKAAKIGAHP
ncbi:MAG: hypothetical protein M1823_001810 [Watsoniomyces obsoletus]|nr:MAG: hypothetical protein M1823_001810 [Watsoniomyces obsoletus]